MAQEQLHWGWAASVRYAKRGMFRLGHERRPQLLCAQSLLLEAMTLTTPTLASCIGLDRWFADP